MFDAAQKTILQQLKMFFFWFKSSPQIWGNMENLKPAYWLFDFLGVCYDIIGGKGWFYLIFAQGWILYTFVYIPMRVHQRENNLDTQKEFDVEFFFGPYLGLQAELGESQPIFGISTRFCVEWATEHPNSPKSTFGRIWTFAPINKIFPGILFAFEDFGIWFLQHHKVPIS